MNLGLDRRKLKIKYFLDIQTETPGYPSIEDYLYELVNLLVETDFLENEFGALWTKDKICTTVGKDKHIEFLQELERLNYIKETSKAKYSSYRLLKHDWQYDKS
ncbi:MAG: hypothetical protein WC979_01230 [Candidatus Pacearchaeota archaeon]|jgi:GTP1/Obg family GTP-binding protein|nr:hypothetical protein [Clostridia bacterium]